MITNAPPVSKPSLPPLLKVRKVGELLAISRQGVKALVDSGDLEARPLNPTRRKMKRLHLRVTRESLASFYRKRFGRDLDTTLQPQFNR